MSKTYLSKDNISQFTQARVAEYPLPFDENMIVRVKSQSIGRVNRYSQAMQDAARKDTPASRERANKETYALVAESIVDTDDQPIFSAQNVKDLAESDCRLVTALVKIIGYHNGGNDKDVEEMAKNLEETE